MTPTQEKTFKESQYHTSAFIIIVNIAAVVVVALT